MTSVLSKSVPLRCFPLRLCGTNNIAKSSLIPDSVIARSQLEPPHGHGCKPRLGPPPTPWRRPRLQQGGCTMAHIKEVDFYSAISRQFEFSRLHDQMLASAYEALIPVVSRQPVCDAHQRAERETGNGTFRSTLTAPSQEPDSNANIRSRPRYRRAPRRICNLRQSFPPNNKPSKRSRRLHALERRVADDALACDPELRFVDDGYSGSTLIRPAARTVSATKRLPCAIDRLYVLSPDRLTTQICISSSDCGRACPAAESNSYSSTHPLGQNPEDNLLLQFRA